MHDHWSLSKVILLKERFLFSGKYRKKEKVEDHGVHQGDI